MPEPTLEMAITSRFERRLTPAVDSRVVQGRSVACRASEWVRPLAATTCMRDIKRVFRSRRSFKARLSVKVCPGLLPCRDPGTEEVRTHRRLRRSADGERVRRSGWNVPYEWMDSDFQAAKLMMSMAFRLVQVSREQARHSKLLG